MEESLIPRERIPETAYVWSEPNQIIYINLPPTFGLSGHEWVKLFKWKGFRFSKQCEDILDSPVFKPTDGVRYTCAILKGGLFSNDIVRTAGNIWSKAEDLSFQKPNLEVACMLRNSIMDYQMTPLDVDSLLVMHEPAKASDGDTHLLNVSREYGGKWLTSYYYAGLHDRWHKYFGFVFCQTNISPKVLTLSAIEVKE